MVVKGGKRKVEESSVGPSSSSRVGSSNNGNGVPSTPGHSRPIPNPLARPRAQRKFAQGVAIYSPPVTPNKAKETSPVKKKPSPPVSPPIKRPKTEDFLNFLCYRGTSALPKKLNFFNYPPPFERGLGKPSNELKSWKYSNPPGKQTSQSTSAISSTQSVSHRSRAESIDTKSKESTSAKSTPTKNVAKKKCSETKQKAEKDKVVKSNKKSTDTVPLSKPKPSNIVEIEAKFAISALKLKYQEKRLARAKPVLNVVNKLTKKVKDRRVILTRSKSKDDENGKPSLSKKKSRKRVEEVSESREPRRNAPSPDIIDGLRHRRMAMKKHTSSESSSSSSSSDDEKKSSTSDSDEESDQKQGTKTMSRSLRSGGKSFVTIPKKAVKKVRKKLPSPNRVSTRASRRNSASPLRELPMYGVLKKRKKLKKKIKAAIIKRTAALRKEREKETKDSDNSRRPTRKTKEYASIYLGLITKEFSSDDNENSGKSHAEDSGGDTSSSETKFLETQYKAILKRDEQKEQDKQSGSKCSKLTERKKLTSNKFKRLPISKKPVLKKPGRKSKIPEKRILRSQSNREDSSEKVSSAARVTRRRVTVPVTPCDKPVHAGAARKSASVVPRKNNSKRSSSSSSTTSSSSSSSDSDESDGAESEEPKAKKDKISVPSPPGRRGTKTKDTEAKDTSGSDGDSESDKCESTNKLTAIRQRTFSPSVNESRIQSETSQPLNPVTETIESSSCSSSDSESDSSSSEEERVVEKVEIAIQVDMDLEESMEQASSGYMQAGHGATPPFTPQMSFVSQGCQSNYLPPHSIPMHIPHSSPMSMTIPHTPPLSMSMTMPHTPPMSMSMPMQMSHPPPQVQMPLQHQQHSQPPSFLPYSSGPSFYPTLSNVEFVTQQRTQQDFSLMLPTLSLPNVPTYNFGPSTVLTQNQIPMPMCFSSTSISAATTLQTHIRSVAANLDIPLVRPVVTPTNLLNLPMTRPTLDPNRPLTRPIMNVWSEHRHPQPNYSAFRVPISTGPGYNMGQRLLAPVSTSQHQQQFSVISNQSQYNMIPLSAPGHVHPPVQSRTIPPVIRPAPMNTTMGTGVPGLSAHGLSLIQSLPNVSIVPKFDRANKAVIIPPDQKPTTSASSSSSIKTSSKTTVKKVKDGPPKEKGRKRKSLSFPQPSSPLTVRKDSSTPATYVGVSSKKNLKGNTEQAGSSSSSVPPNPFSKLLELKKSDSDSSSKEKPPRPPKKSEVDEDKGSRPKKAANPGEKSPKPKKTNADGEKAARPHKKLDAGGDKDKPRKSIETEKEKPPRQPKKSQSESPRPDSADRFKALGESEEKGEKVEDAPAYFPTDEEFQDPLKYISQIQKEGARFGIARIVPPRSFRPECNVEDDMRFTAYNHYIHRMYKRWGSNVQERVAMMEHVRKSKVDVSTSTPPMIGGMEIDLTTLYHTVQGMGGLTEVIQKDKWNKVSDAMHIPKAANDRASKLDAVYVKYVLPYEMLSDNERKKILNEVDKKWKAREKKRSEESESESEDEDDPFEEVENCIVKGKSTPLSSYYRVARNTLSMIFKNKEPSWGEVESSYWKLVRDKDRHLCVYSGSIDCAGLGWGFPLPKPGTKHPWNLKVLANSPGSLLKSMGPVMGATIPTLHVGMVYTTYCWYRDPHGLPWVEYLHSGGNKIWYVVPASHEDAFRQVLTELMPRQCKDKKIWLASDSAMVPPELLLARGVPLYRAVQNPGEFLVAFPRAFTSAICTGYVISESVCFALPQWISTAANTFQDIRDSKEPPAFALEKLMLSILADPRVSVDILNMILPLAERLINEEIGLRKKLRELGVRTGKMSSSDEKITKKSKKKDENEVHECDTCNYILHLSLVNNKSQELVYCLPHALQYFSKNKSRIKASLLLFDKSEEQLRSALETAQARLK